ncbi:MAG: lipoyl(octanoyl) transferase, partial [Planctomycetes bacterium]|nr:lipoyl(octanoyl) transferase [Planctomycetota bacterium]
QHPPVMEAHLLATVDYHRCVELQKRLVYESGGRTDGQITLLLCEHASIITVGRAGSPGEIHIGTAERRSRQLDVQWVNRGGGCMVHTPGQLAVYPIVPLSWHGMSVGRYLDCLQKGLLAALAELGIRGRTEPGRYGIWGRSGQLAALGVAVRNWITYHGAFLNVAPEMQLFGRVQTDPEGLTRMSSLVAERHDLVTMTSVRAEVVRHLAEALGCPTYHLYTGHPLLRDAT